MKKLVKILEIVSYSPPRTGWSTRVEYLKKQLLEMGYECQILNISSESRRIKSDEYIDVQNGRDYIFKLGKFCLSGYRVHMHVNGQSPKGFILTLISEIIGLVLGKGCFLTFHGGINQRYFPRENSYWILPLISIIFKLPKKIICNDERIKDKISEYGINRNKIVSIPAFSKQYLSYKETKLPEDLEIFIHQHEPILSSYVFDRPQFYIPTTLQAIKKLVTNYPDLGLIFVGTSEYSQDTLNLIQTLNLEKNIFLCKNLEHNEFLTLLSKSKICIRSYEWDGVCSSVLQALSLKIPVIGCENPLRPKGVVLFKTGDENSLAEKIEYILKNYDEVKENIQLPEIKDTVSTEVKLLTSI
ncbi:MAG: glycosyltransferase [bacterium]